MFICFCTILTLNKLELLHVEHDLLKKKKQGNIEYFSQVPDSRFITCLYLQL